MIHKTAVVLHSTAAVGFFSGACCLQSAHVAGSRNDNLNFANLFPACCRCQLECHAPDIPCGPISRAFYFNIVEENGVAIELLKTLTFLVGNLIFLGV